MTEPLKKIYKIAKHDMKFNQIYKEMDEKIPGLLSDSLHKHIYVSVYYGYLLGSDIERAREINKISKERCNYFNKRQNRTGEAIYQVSDIQTLLDYIEELENK